MLLRRARGLILRLARRRAAAVVAGLTLVAVAVWLEYGGATDAWWVDGLSLVLGGTGIALMWTGLVGVKPDWIDETQNREH